MNGPRALVEAAISLRDRLMNIAGITFDGQRNLYKALGYKRRLAPMDYRSRFNRNAVANRVVKALPKATWRGGAEIIEDEDPTTETAFEAAVADLDKRLSTNDGLGIWAALQQADTLAGIGRYAIIMIGAPGKSAEPLLAASMDEITYLQPYAEEDAKIERFIIDDQDPRFGRPEFYTVQRVSTTGDSVNSPAQAMRVHWTRCIHIAEGTLDDSVYGEPRLRCIWNLIDDLEKVTGGGAEAFWKRADQGTVFDLDPMLKIDQPSKDALKKQIHEYEHDMRRFLLTRGVEAKTLGSDVADFSKPVESIISQISAGTGIPQRILMGSEEGKLAGTSDRSNWDDRVADRRLDFAEIKTRSLIDRFISIGALPTPLAGDYDVSFGQLKVLDDAQRAGIAKDWASLNQLTSDTVVTPDDIRERVLNLPPLQDTLHEGPGGGTPPPAPTPGVPTAASAKGGASHVHRVADRFSGPRPTYRQRLLRRRAASAAAQEAGASTQREKQEGGQEPDGTRGGSQRTSADAHADSTAH